MMLSLKQLEEVALLYPCHPIKKKGLHDFMITQMGHGTRKASRFALVKKFHKH